MGRCAVILSVVCALACAGAARCFSQQSPERVQVVVNATAAEDIDAINAAMAQTCNKTLAALNITAAAFSDDAVRVTESIE